MRKIITILLITFIFVFAVGCAKNVNNNQQITPSNQSEQTPDIIPSEPVPTDTSYGVPNVTDIGGNPDTGAIDNISVDTALNS